MNMTKDKDWIAGWYKCRGCNELFLPTTSRNFYCWKCTGKKSYKRKGTENFFGLSDK